MHRGCGYPDRTYYSHRGPTTSRVYYCWLKKMNLYIFRFFFFIAAAHRTSSAGTHGFRNNIRLLIRPRIVWVCKRRVWLVLYIYIYVLGTYIYIYYYLICESHLETILFDWQVTNTRIYIMCIKSRSNKSKRCDKCRL